MRPAHKKICIAFLASLLLAGVVYAVFFRLGPSDCTSLEHYDSLTGSCYYDCNNDKDCANKAAKVDAELNQFFAGSASKLSAQDHGQQAARQPSAGQAAGTRLLTKDFTGSDTDGTIYTVAGDQTLRPKPAKDHQQLWELFSRVAGTEDIGRYIQSFEVFDEGNNDSAASVWTSQTAGKWHVNVNAAYTGDRKDLLHTMVHEYGHIVSLNNAQVPQVTGACPRLELPEGCANTGSYIQAFYTQFWQKYGSDVPSDMGEDQNEVQDFYDARKSSFVSGYAATNYGEDWAESWAVFVTSSKPVSSQEKDAKVRFFYSYPELVNIRNRIRVQIAESNK